MSKNITKTLVVSAMSIAVATVLSMIKIYDPPMGGSITLCSMLFVTIVGYLFGLRQGLVAGFTYGIIQLILGPYIIHPAQLILDYFLSFGALGLSGCVRNKKHGLIAGYWIGVTGRFVFSFLSGFIFFGSACKDYGLTSPIIYSILYNAAYLYGEAVLTTVILVIPAVQKAIGRIKTND